MQILKYIRNRVFRTYCRVGAAAHIRHWRGHGVHSPFMYSLIRNVFMKRHLMTSDTRFFKMLIAAKCEKRCAVILQNLYTQGNYTSFCIVESNVCELKSTLQPQLYIVTHRASLKTLAETAEKTVKTEATLCVLSNNSCSSKRRLCKNIYLHNSCVCVEKAHMAIFFFNPKLQKQHYNL